MAEWLGRLTLHRNKVVGSNLSLRDKRSKRETSRKISFYGVCLVSLLAFHNISFYFKRLAVKRLAKRLLCVQRTARKHLCRQAV